VCQELAKNLARELKELREEKGAKARARSSRRGALRARLPAQPRSRPAARRSSKSLTCWRRSSRCGLAGTAPPPRPGCTLRCQKEALSHCAVAFACALLSAQACDPDTAAGEWLAKLDLVEAGKKLKVVEQPRPGKCGTECRTAARACVEALADHDTDLAEAIFAQRGDPAASGRAPD
jgi:hypothetical protein